ncbi:MAG: aminotransferase class I/II-fold pyridoxal phosphate-dependent enzyme [Xanthomonadaceae bacterium]|nr:aminotransferase class I/II-fold pyridoxal phosphate-dependent enzyme [Xanthomonadaceae bacterium]
MPGHSSSTVAMIRNRDLLNGESKALRSFQQYHSLASEGYLSLLGRVFHSCPSRETRASYGMGQYATADADRYSRQVLNFGSYNYSGLNGHPRIVAAAEAALRKYGTTTSGVRLFNGTSELHLELEERLAGFLGFEACITFSSGYTANLSTLSLLCGPTDAVLSDGPDRRKFIVTDGVFSMDGDIADVPGLVSLAERYNAFLILDDAHATGAIGPNGRGTAAHFGVQSGVDLVTGSLSKGLPGVGGFAAGSRRTIEAMRLGAHSYVFSASIPPAVVAGLCEAIRILEEDQQIQERLRTNESTLRDGIVALGLDCMSSETPIIPVAMPSLNATLRMTKEMFEQGIYINPVGYPAVTQTRNRLRLNASAEFRNEDIQRCLEALSVAKGRVLDTRDSNNPRKPVEDVRSAVIEGL